MKQTLQTKSLLTALLLFVFSLGATAQTTPVAFDFTVVPTAAQCEGQGVFTFVLPPGLNPSASISFAVYTGTSATGVPTIVSSPPYVVRSLAAGPYTIVGTYTVIGSAPVSVTHQGTITTTTARPVYNVTSQNIHCSNDGVISVATISGAARDYSLTGPVTRPTQTSPIFENLGVGTYRLVVTDVCGNIRNFDIRLDQAHTLIRMDPYVYPYGVPKVWELPSCNTIAVEQRIYTTGEDEIFYPINIEYLVTDPITGQVTTVAEPPFDTPPPPTDPNNVTYITTPIPFYNDVDYSYTMKITDACGTVFTKDQVIHRAFSVSPEVVYGHCKEIVNLNLFNWSGETTVHFTSPPGFDATANQYNPEHPNHSMANGSPIAYGDHFPEGNYEADVTNCDGRTVHVTFNVDRPDPALVWDGIIDCDTGQATISGTLSPATTNFVSVTLVTAPAGYIPGPEGNDWTTGIDDQDPSKFKWTGGVGPAPAGVLIPGTYRIQAVDECDIPYDEVVTLVLDLGGIVRINVNNLPGCDVNVGSVRVQDDPDPGQLLKQISSAKIMQGPPEWTLNNPTPFDLVNNIGNDGIVYINNLPEGDYVFQIGSASNPDCPGRLFNVNVIGYEVAVDSVDVTIDCSAFTVKPIREGSNNLGGFFIQRLITDTTDPNVGKWTDPRYDRLNPLNDFAYYAYDPTPVAPQTTAPEMGVNSTTGDPNQFKSNAQQLSAPFIDADGNYVPIASPSSSIPGEYRVMEQTFIHGNGQRFGEQCFKELAHFTFGGNISLDDVIFTSTSQTTVTATLIATGFGTLQYNISSPIVTTPQLSPVFEGLDVGTTYLFTVTNECGDTENVEKLASPQTDPVIAQIGNCEGTEVILSVTPFVDLYTYEWTKVGESTPVVSAVGNLVFPVFSAGDAGDYVLRVFYEPDPNLFDRTLPPFHVDPPNVLNAGLNNLNNSLCTNPLADRLNLNNYLVAHPDLGTPDAGVFTDANGTVIPDGLFDIASVTTDGILNFFYTVSDPACPNIARASIRFNVNQTPVVTVAVNPGLIVCEGNAFSLTASSTTPGVTYSWTKPDGTTQAGSIINMAGALSDAGNYTVKATSANGACESLPVTTTIAVTAAVTAGDDVNVPALCSNSATNIVQLDQFISASATTGGTFTVGTNPIPGTFNGVEFDTANLVGTYDFIYTVSACGISDDAVITFTINPTPNDPVISVVAPVVCENGSIELKNTDVADSYSWTKGGTVVSTVQNPVIPATIAAAGDYVLTITVNGCTATSAPVNVVVTPLPQFSLAGNTIICPTQFTTLSVVPVNFAFNDANISYDWTLNGTSVSNTETARVDQVGDYVVTITDANGGCPASHTITVTADPDPFSIVLAGDCVNDHFIMSITNIAEIGTTQSIVWSGPGLSATTGNSPTIDLTAKDKGIYEVTVTNADGCFKTQTIDVTSTSCMIPRGISPDNGDTKNDFFDLTNLGVQNLQIFNRYGLQVYEKNNYTKEWYGQSDKGDLPTGTYFYVVKMADKQVTGWVYIQRNSN